MNLLYPRLKAADQYSISLTRAAELDVSGPRRGRFIGFSRAFWNKEALVICFNDQWNRSSPWGRSVFKNLHVFIYAKSHGGSKVCRSNSRVSLITNHVPNFAHPGVSRGSI